MYCHSLQNPACVYEIARQHCCSVLKRHQTCSKNESSSASRPPNCFFAQSCSASRLSSHRLAASRASSPAFTVQYALVQCTRFQDTVKRTCGVVLFRVAVGILLQRRLQLLQLRLEGLHGR